MDLILLFLIISCVSLLAVTSFAKDPKLKSTANKVMSVVAVLIVLYLSLTQYLIPETQPEPVPDPDPAITVVDPSGNDVTEPDPEGGSGGGTAALIDEDGIYDSKEDVALYIHTYGKLPPNYITKNEAEKLGWSGGSVEQVAPGKCIGGSRFYNNEKKLPEKSGRKYYECDIDTLGYHSRGSRRIIYSNDGLIYYTGDHYETYELLYGEE